MKYLTTLLAFVLAAPCLAAQSQDTSELANLLPEDSLFYFEIHDVPGLRDGLANGAMGRIFNDPKVQDFVGGMVGMGMQQWESFQSMGAEQGMPVQFMSWDAYKSISFGASISAGETPDQPGVFFGFEINLAEGYGAPAFGMISGALQAQGAATLEETDGKQSLRMITPPDAPEITLSMSGDRMQLIGKLNVTSNGSLSNSASFLRGRKQVMKPGMICSGYYSPKAGLAMQKNFLRIGVDQSAGEIESIAKAVTGLAEEAVGNAEGISFAAGWDKGESLGLAFVDFGGKEPGWAYSASSIDRELINYIPHNADSFGLASFSGGEGFDHLMGGFDEVMGHESMQEPLAIWAEAEPVSYSWVRGENRSLLDAAMKGFGTRAFSYNVPSVGLISALEVTDPVAVQNAATPLVKAIAKALDSIPDIPVAIRAKRESQRSNPGESIPIYYLRIKTDALPPEMQQMAALFGAIEPSIAISPDGWLIFSMTRANVRSIIRSGMVAQENNILENPEAASFIGRVPGGAMSVRWSDPRPGIKQGMGFLQGVAGFGQSFVDNANLPFELDLTKIPSGDVINAHLRPSETVTWMDKEGLKTIAKGSVGFADFIALAGYAIPMGAGAATYFMGAREESEVAFEAPTALIEPTERPTEPLAATHYELNRLQTGILLYEWMNEQQLPASLNDLTGTGPEGQNYLDRPEEGIYADGWGQAFVYKLIDGGFTLYSVGPDGVDNGGHQGDDITLD